MAEEYSSNTEYLRVKEENEILRYQLAEAQQKQKTTSTVFIFVAVGIVFVFALFFVFYHNSRRPVKLMNRINALEVENSILRQQLKLKRHAHLPSGMLSKPAPQRKQPIDYLKGL